MNRFLPLAAATCALTVSLAACGSQPSGSGSAGATAPASPAPARTLSLTEVNGSVAKALATNKSVKITGSGTMKSGPSKLTVVISTANGAPEYDMTIDTTEDGKPQHVRMLMLKDGVYFNTGEPVEPGKTWAKADAGSKNPLARIFLVLGASMKSVVDPQQQKLTADAGGTLTGAKPEKLGGVDTTRYTITVDVAKALQKVDLRHYLGSITDAAGAISQIPGLDAKTAAETKTVAKLKDADLEKLRANMIKAAAGTTSTTDLWLDTAGNPVKQAVNVAGGKADQQVELTYSDWGRAAITVPPADQVASMPEMPKMP